jgi:hypothetical protein
MQAPFDGQQERSPREVLIDECRLCFAAAAGCGVIGLIGVGYHRLSGVMTPLAALLVVAGFYAIMGCGRLVKYFFTPVNGATVKELDQ